MTPIVAAQAIVGIIAAIALIAFWFGPRRWIVTDIARNDMFAAREEFFDEAAAGRVAFSDPNYRRVREAINSNIRFAHTISIVRIVLHIWALKRHRTTLASNVRAAASAIADPEARRAAHRALNRVESIALRLLFFRSPILGALLLLSILPARGVFQHASAGIWRALRNQLQPYSDAIQAEALTA